MVRASNFPKIELYRASFLANFEKLSKHFWMAASLCCLEENSMTVSKFVNMAVSAKCLLYVNLQSYLNYVCSHIQRRIQNPAKHLRWRAFEKNVNSWKSLTIFTKIYIIDVWQGIRLWFMQNVSKLELKKGSCWCTNQHSVFV